MISLAGRDILHGWGKFVLTGVVPFEVREMRARPEGFELAFTLPVDRAKAADPAHYALCLLYTSRCV